jgi:hypothetical protein
VMLGARVALAAVAEIYAWRVMNKK